VSLTLATDEKHAESQQLPPSKRHGMHNAGSGFASTAHELSIVNQGATRLLSYRQRKKLHKEAKMHSTIISPIYLDLGEQPA